MDSGNDDFTEFTPKFPREEHRRMKTYIGLTVLILPQKVGVRTDV